MSILTEKVLSTTMDDLRHQIADAIDHYESIGETHDFYDFAKAEVTFYPASLEPMDSICEQTAEDAEHDNHTWQTTSELVSVATYTDYLIETKYCTECPAAKAIFHNMDLQLDTQ